jgi:hypothetical protein
MSIRARIANGITFFMSIISPLPGITRLSNVIS